LGGDIVITFSTNPWAMLKALRPVRKLDVLTAYLGRGASRVVRALRVRRLRLVFGMDARNVVLSEFQIRELRELRRFGQVRVCRGLHAKVYLCDDSSVVVGSANFTRAGFGRLEEALVCTDEPSTMQAARKYFDRIWKRESRRLPAKARTSSRHSGGEQPGEENTGALGMARVKKASPFDGEQTASGEARGRGGTRHGVRVRLCAYPSGWLRRGLDSEKEVKWSTGAGAKAGDVQVFAIFPEVWI
jgi:hypothetical protein